MCRGERAFGGKPDRHQGLGSFTLPRADSISASRDLQCAWHALSAVLCRSKSSMQPTASSWCAFNNPDCIAAHLLVACPQRGEAISQN